MRGSLVVVTGTSGSGKTSIRKIVTERVPDLWFSVSCTTRKPRPGERDGVDYYFVSREEFEEMIRNGEFLEHAEYAGNLYGTPIKPVMEKIREGKIVYLEIEIQGFFQVREKFPRLTSVFITTPSLGELERRIRERGTETEEKIMERLERAKEEMKHIKEFDFVVVNEDIERSARHLAEILVASRHRMLEPEEFLKKWHEK